MSNIFELAKELKVTLAIYRPVCVDVVESKPRRVSPSQTPERQRLRYLKWKQKHPATPMRLKYGKMKLVAQSISEQLGISLSGARQRMYRRAVPPDVMKIAMQTK